MERISKFIPGFFLAVIISGTLTACGGGGGSAPALVTGKFVDGPVAGLNYAGYNSGITDPTGSFSYPVGSSVKFSVGDIVLGEAPAAPVVTPLQLVPGSNASTPQVVNIVRFLLSIGSVDANGNITIPGTVTAAAKGKSINFATASDDELAALVKAVTQNAGATLIDGATATTHLSQCIYSQFQGTYTGGMSGAAGSTWKVTVTITPDGTLSGILAKGNGVTETLNGVMQAGTDFQVVASGGCVFTGTLDPATGTISGSWKDSIGSAMGTFTIK